jgi:hypothetical protein
MSAMLSLIKRVLDTCIETLKEVNKITDNNSESVKQAFEETALAKWPVDGRKDE